ncbi:MAG: hypothetical protein MUE70_00985 [Desulfobacterales bacterium]|jgi:hypothetical protein|nr:hypothetical protein [Desulfobacterales bacterium]
MKFELNREYNLRVMLATAHSTAETFKEGRKMVKRVKVVAMPLENEAVIEFIGVKKYYQGLGLPVRGRLHMTAGVPVYLLAGDEKYEIMNVIA